VTNRPAPQVCAVCGKPFKPRQLRRFEVVRPSLNETIAQVAPDWGPGGAVCLDDLRKARARYVESMLRTERGELTALDREVIDSLATGETITQQLSTVVDERASFGERAADRVAAFGGSWTFILSFGAVLFLWMGLNVTGLLFKPFDPYPFILLNLVLSSLAAVQAPVIMMSQRRQETKDRLRAENDYRINLKAELEIRQLHEKIDHQMAHQWEKLAELQQIQIDLLEDAIDKKRAPRGP
jgi:uncharacterized membrane protein